MITTFSKLLRPTLLPQLLKTCQRVTMAKYSTVTLFTDAKQAEYYAKFRPNYTDEVFQRIIDFSKNGTCDFQLAIDVGCGSGQSSKPLAKHFKQVVGVDVSKQQIANAPTDIPNLNFRVSAAEDLSFAEAASVDLVTVAQAFHWLNENKFYEEVNRVLKPGGSLVVYGYGICHLEGKEADGVLQHVYAGILGKYWAEGRRMVEEKYATVNLPFPGWYRDDSMTLKKECSIEDLVGYVGSWSAYIKYKEANPEEDLLGQMLTRLQNACQNEKEAENSSGTKLVAKWPVFMLLGHKPK